MVEHAALKFLGIYPEQIQDADETVEYVCKEHGIDSDSQVWEFVERDFKENIFDGDDLSDVIVCYIFRNLKAALVESGKFTEEQIDWYINGTLDTNFYIDGEQV